MKYFVIALLVSAVAAFPQHNQELRRPHIAITRYENTATGDGGNQYVYETENGINREEGITLKRVQGIDENGNQVERLVPVYRGSWTYVRDDGSTEEIRYVADELGIRFEGASVPVAPEAHTQ